MYFVEYEYIFLDAIYFLLNINIFSLKEIYFIEYKDIFLNMKYFSFNINIFY